MFIWKIWLAVERRVALASNHVGLRSCRLVGIPINLEVWHFLDCFDFHSPPYLQTFKLTGVGEGNCPSHSFHCFCVKWTNIIGGIFLSGCFLRSSFSNFGWDAEPANYSLLKKRGEGGSSYLSFDFFFSFFIFREDADHVGWSWLRQREWGGSSHLCQVCSHPTTNNWYFVTSQIYGQTSPQLHYLWW